MILDPAFCPSTPLSSPTGEGHLLNTLNPLIAPLPDPSLGPPSFLPGIPGIASFCDWSLGL